IIKTAKKHNIIFAPIKMSKNIKKQLPAWHNIGAPQNTYHKSKNKCLQETHNVQNIKNLIKCRKRLTRLSGDPLHVPRKTCACSDCKRDKNKGCKNPHYCAQIANEILSKLAPKFNTKSKPKKDDLSLTHHRKEKNNQAHERRTGELLFDPSITIRSNVSEGFRIFTNPEHISLTPAHRLQTPIR
ncbi:hypothetical protein C8R48DRAFT_567296, partial [Suillus tomentosus]